MELQLQQARVIKGSVVDAEGQPWAGATVIFRERSLGLTGRSQADEAGRFELVGVPHDKTVEVWPSRGRRYPQIRVAPGVLEVRLAPVASR